MNDSLLNVFCYTLAVALVAILAALVSSIRRFFAAALSYRILGQLIDLEYEPAHGGGKVTLPFKGCYLAVDRSRQRLHVICGSESDWLALGWRPWPRAIGRVASITYSTPRFLSARRMGFLDRRGAALAARWGSPLYTHEFEQPTRLVLGAFGGLSISGAALEVERNRIGELGMIHG